MTPFKVWLLNNDIVEKIIIFNGDNVEDFGIFSDEELDLVDSDNTIVSRSMIHSDDSICEVKHKIMKEIDCLYGDIYLFCYKKRKINLNQLMSSFTTRESLEQFMKNIDLDGININDTMVKLSLAVDEETILSLKTSLGMHTDDPLFSPNPFHATDNFETIMTVNDNLLIGNDIECNNIYMCLAKDLRTNRLYFPHFGRVEPPLHDMDAIDELYRVFYNRHIDNVSTSGVESFELEIDTHNPVPLNNVFQDIHSDAEFPFIQYNRGFHIDNVYRLYGVTITKNGKRIPLLNKEKIMELSSITTGRQIAIYNRVYDLLIIINASGVITVRASFKPEELKTVYELETILKTTLNPLFTKYCNYEFKSFHNHKIRMNYQYSSVSSNLDKKYVEAIFGKDYRYRRVNNYAQLDNFHTFLYDIYVKHGRDTVRELVVRHKFNKDDAEQLTRDFLNKNAGATTTIINIGNNLLVRVYDLDSVEYIPHLNLYLDALVMLSTGRAKHGENTIAKVREIAIAKEVESDSEEESEEECNTSSTRIGFSDDEGESEKDNHEVWLENNFFTLYRSLVLSLLESEERYTKVIDGNMIKELTDPVAVFSKISKPILESLSNDQMNASALMQNERQLLFPERNLITRELNRVVYSERMADEISKMQHKLANEAKELMIRDNEFVVLDSLLKSPDYFIDMVPSETNECLRMVPSTNIWRFFANTNRLEFKATPECSFGPLVYILHDVKKQLYKISTIKKMLWNAYRLLFSINKGKMISMMNLKNANLDIEEFMKSEAYYMTPLDMWVFAETYRIPVIMFSSTDRSWSVLGGEETDQFFFYESNQGWPNNVLINRTFSLNEMTAEFASEFDNKIISVRKYLA